MEKVLDYNKVWTLLIALGLIVLIDYLGYDLNTIVEGAALVFGVYAVPNGRLPFQKSRETQGS